MKKDLHEQDVEVKGFVQYTILFLKLTKNTMVQSKPNNELGSSKKPPLANHQPTQPESVKVESFTVHSLSFSVFTCHIPSLLDLLPWRNLNWNLKRNNGDPQLQTKYFHSTNHFPRKGSLKDVKSPFQPLFFSHLPPKVQSVC